MSPEQRACSRLSGETGHIGRLLMIGPSEALFDELRRQAGPRDHDLQSCANCVEALLQLRLHSWDVRSPIVQPRLATPSQWHVKFRLIDLTIWCARRGSQPGRQTVQETAAQRTHCSSNTT